MNETVTARGSRYVFALLQTITIGVILSLAVCDVSNVVARVQSDSSQWNTFASPAGRFSVLMPGTPVPKNSDWQTPAGKIAFHELTSALANVSYSVGYLDYADTSNAV